MKRILIFPLLTLLIKASTLMGQMVALPEPAMTPMEPKVNLKAREVGAARATPIFAKAGPVSSRYLKNEIGFWSRQMGEHALFLYLGLNETEVPELKRRGLVLHKKFQAFRDRFMRLSPRAITPQVISTYKRLLAQLRSYKKNVLKAVLAGWSGYIHPSFAQHILLELNYHVQNINGIKHSAQDEIKFWNTINGDHANFAKHLLDPTEVQLVEQADELAKKFAQLGKMVQSEDDMMIQLSLNAAKQLDAYGKTAQAGIRNRSIRSVIHPVLIAHVGRETDQGLKTLRRIGAGHIAAQWTVPASMQPVVASPVITQPVVTTPAVMAR